MSQHTCIRNDGGCPNRSCDACDEEKAQKAALVFDPTLRHAMSGHDVSGPATATELRTLAKEMEESLVENECRFSHPDWRYVDGLRALADKLDELTVKALRKRSPRSPY